MSAPIFECVNSVHVIFGTVRDAGADEYEDDSYDSPRFDEGEFSIIFVGVGGVGIYFYFLFQNCF